MYILDAHSDIFADIALKREQGKTKNFIKDHLPSLNEGNVKGIIMPMWVEPIYEKNPKKRFFDIMNYVQDELKELGDSVCIAKTIDDIEKAEAQGKLYIILGIEGLSGIGTNIDYIYNLYEMGVRHIGLTWNERNDFATGIGSMDVTRGLTRAGKKSLEIMDELGILIDVSHLNEKSFWDVCDYSKGIIIASHSNARKICNANRNLTDAQIIAIAKKRGVIGMNSWSSFVRDNAPDVKAFVDHIEYIVSLVGIDYVGLGFDFCDYFESDPTSTDPNQMMTFTEGLESCRKIPNLIEILYKRGFSEMDIEKIAYMNFRRVINEVWSARLESKKQVI